MSHLSLRGEGAVGKVLSRIEDPRDLKTLSFPELEKLCQELREEITEVVSKTGGHLAPNLGAVELTIALHYVFDSPQDKIIFDVGHQCYAHKLLTGRRERFHTLRQYGGISGFPRREESPHDAFGTGHGSTSISAALGMAVAERLKGGKGHTIAVIGDGSMTGGLAYEGLNNAGMLKVPLIVVLNDNQMAISPSVGAMAQYLAKIRSDPHYLKAKEAFEDLMRRLPLGKQVLETVERLKASIKSMLVPGMLFEELGFTYLGPVDGHDLRALISVLERAKRMEKPVLVHIVTRKGKGYKPAERDAAKFHGVPPFDVESGELEKPKRKTYTDVFSEALVELACEDKRIVAITAAMPSGTGLDEFSKQFPERFFDVGMAEGHAVTFAAGLAASGLKPVVAIYSTFLQRAYDHILHDVCIQNLPVVFCLDRAGIVGEDGLTHQGLFDLSYLRHLPNITIMAPKDEAELRDMLYTALRLDSPCAIRYPRGTGEGVELRGEFQEIPIGKAEVLREGREACIWAMGNRVWPALRAAEAMDEEEGISCTVVNARFVKPLDEELLLEKAKTHLLLVTVEENVLQGGFGSAVLEAMEGRSVEAKIVRLGIPGRFVEHGPPEILRKKYGLDEEGIRKTIRARLESKQLNLNPRS